MNPAAKVLFARRAGAASPTLAIRHDAYVIADEVYEHIVVRRAGACLDADARPGCASGRCAIGSAGKSFSLTGWKVGYVTAAPALLDPIAKAHQFTTFTTPPNLQKAVAYGLAKERCLFQRPGWRACRRSATGWRQDCADIGFGVIPCEGTYFLTLDMAPLGLDGDDVALASRMTVEAGVTAVPVSAFYGADRAAQLSSASASPSATRCWTRPRTAWSAGSPRQGAPPEPKSTASPRSRLGGER